MSRWLSTGAFDWERIEAIDGLQLHTDIIFKINNGSARVLKRGEIGCALSHIEAWKIALGTNHSHFLFLEDDVQPVLPPIILKQKLIELKSQTQWDIMYVTGESNAKRFKKLCNRKHLYPYLQSDLDFCDGPSINKLYFYAGPQIGAYSYMVTRQGLVKLIDFFSENLLNPVDVQIGQMNTWLKTGMTKERLVSHKFDGNSDSQRI